MDLEKNISLLKAFPYNISTINLFLFSRPKIIAEFVGKNLKLFELQSCIIKVVCSFGIKFFQKKFVSHLTLERLKRTSNLTLDSYFRSLTLNSFTEVVTIYHSILIPKGAIYKDLMDIPLDFFK